MVELHNNFTFEGSKTGRTACSHEPPVHEPIEITAWIHDWFRGGIYFHRAQNGHGGTGSVTTSGRACGCLEVRLARGREHSQEFGYQRGSFAGHGRTNCVPLVDKRGAVVSVLHPTFDKSFHAQAKTRDFVF